jgi:hypothetical protein
MNNALKYIENNALAALINRAPSGITQAIKDASAKTGVSFAYLMDKAAAESSFNPNAKAKTSSATGLFQFIESTWMDMVKKHGDKHGINTDQSRQDLLNLRKDPAIASVMAAEFAQDNKNILEQRVGGTIGETEMYFAHFMGAGGASAFLNQLKTNPLSIGADLFPQAARANKNVFYDQETGAPKTLEQIYAFFDKKFKSKNASTTLAHKPVENDKGGYQHIPPSLKKPIEVENRISNSLFQMQSQLRQMDAFFATPFATQEKGFDHFPTSFYSNLGSQTSLFLSLLKD